jgi:hypothetical protein
MRYHTQKSSSKLIFLELEPLGFAGQIIQPRLLNDRKQNGLNKANVELEHIGNLIKNLPDPFENVIIHVDRLGGRRYYTEPLQAVNIQIFPDILDMAGI